MARLYDENIANLLGSVDSLAVEGGGTQQLRDAAAAAAPQWIVLEHLPLGDLKQFLRRHRPSATTTADIAAAESTDNTLRWDYERQRLLYTRPTTTTTTTNNNNIIIINK